MERALPPMAILLTLTLGVMVASFSFPIVLAVPALVVLWVGASLSPAPATERHAPSDGTRDVGWGTG